VSSDNVTGVACLAGPISSYLSKLGRYRPDLERELADSDLENRKYHQFLKKHLAFMEDIIKSLKEVQA